MKKWIIRFLGLKGSWKWAYKQMKEGKIVFRISDTGAAKYKLDNENQQRIMWTFTHHPSLKDKDWQNAYVFLDMFNNTNWVIFDPALYHQSYRIRWKNYGYKKD